VAAVFGGALSRPVHPPEVLLVIDPHATDLADQFRCEPARLTSRPSRGFQAVGNQRCRGTRDNLSGTEGKPLHCQRAPTCVVS
jgi:hypothetical protein